MKMHPAAYLGLLFLLLSCGGNASSTDASVDARVRPDLYPPAGTERGPCYSNKTCNAGLTCLSGFCVRMTDLGVGEDAARPDASGLDARIPDALADAPKPDAPKPDLLKPDVLKPDVLKPDVLKPDVLKPDVLKPDVLKPDTMSPDTMSPDTMSPDTCSPNGCGGCTTLSSALGAACGTCGVYACNGPNAVACLEASEMVPLAGYCVDGHEGSVWSSAACTGTQYGISSADFPVGFPVNVASKGVLGATETVALYACSIANVTPTRFISWYQAKRACENAGKRLCTEAEWIAMCKGSSGYAYPYGNTYQPTWCNTADAASGGVAKTGQFPQCTGGYTGLFDVGGNLSEMVTDASGTGCVSARGGTYLNGSEYAQCDPARWTCPGAAGQPNMGFRCCRTRP